MRFSNLLFIFSLVFSIAMAVTSLLLEDYSLIYYSLSPMILAVMARNVKLDKFTKELIPKINTMVSIMLILALAIISTKASVNGIYDFSSNSRNTLSSQTVSILEGLKDQDTKIEFRTYFTDKVRQGKFKHIMALFQNVYGNIRVKNYDPLEDSLKAKKDPATKADTCYGNKWNAKKLDKIHEKAIAEGIGRLIGRKKVLFCRLGVALLQ